MSDFKSRFAEELESAFEILSENDVYRIAEQAARFKRETETEATVERLIEEMKKLPHRDPVDKWNTVVGRLHLNTWGENGDNPYQV